MKRSLFAFFALLLAVSMCFASCFGKENDGNSSSGTGDGAQVSYDFYAKTPSSHSDREVTSVIEVKAEKKTYTGEGDIHVMATVGFGHLPGTVDFGNDPKDFLRVECVIIEEPYADNKRPSWENFSEYEGSWSDEKYNSTAKDADGEFYPTYSDVIELVFPIEVEKGHLVVKLVNVYEDGSCAEFESLKIYFEHKDGTLTLNP